MSTTERQLGESLSIHAPTTVIPNGIDLAEFRPAAARDRIHARKLLGLDDVPIVLCVGALSVQKGQQDLLTDWPAVRAQVPEAQLILVGDGPDRQALERLAEGVEGVMFAGARTDVPLWMAAADVVVVPSRWEGMALVPLEAMACARSVVATDVNGIDGQRPARRGCRRGARRPAGAGRGAGRSARGPPARRGRGLARPVPRRVAPRRDDLSA